MTSNYYQSQISKIEKEIADLHSKIAIETKRDLDKSKQIESVSSSITKNTSPATIQSRNKQISGYKSEILAIKKKIADYHKKVSDKSAELGKRKQDLLLAEESERKKTNQEQLIFQNKLTQDIEKHKTQLDYLINKNYAPAKLNLSEDIEQSDSQKQYDFFISHASEDKMEIVNDLAIALRENGFHIWYDDFELKIGDSLRRNIDRGLVNSQYGIVIISPNFINKNWPEYELNGMVAREMNGHKVILPIWHKVTKDEVLRYSPTLVDKVALNTTIHSIDEIVSKLKELRP